MKSIGIVAVSCLIFLVCGVSERPVGTVSDISASWVGAFVVAAASASEARASGPLVPKPGFVAVDHVERKKELEETGVLASLCDRGNPWKPEGVMDAISRSTDKRFNPVSKYLRAAGASCFAGRKDVCKEIREYALEWADSGGPSIPRSWGGTITANMRLLNPLISALAFAEADESLSTDAREKVDAWLKEKVDEATHGMRHDGYYEGRRHGIADGISVRKAAHNHAIQSSLAAMSFGAWVGDDEYFKTGLEQWHITLGSMREDGSLPIETRRGAAALYYQGRTISGLIQLAERARAQGVDLYGQSPRPGATIHRAVQFFVDAVENPELVLPYAVANHAPKGGSRFSDYNRQHLGGLGSTMGWFAPYARQFPDHPNVRRIRNFDPNISYLAPSLVRAARRNGYSAEWIGVNASCFYSAVRGK